MRNDFQRTEQRSGGKKRLKEGQASQTSQCRTSHVLKMHNSKNNTLFDFHGSDSGRAYIKSPIGCNSVIPRLGAEGRAVIRQIAWWQWVRMPETIWKSFSTKLCGSSYQSSRDSEQGAFTKARVLGRSIPSRDNWRLVVPLQDIEK